MQRGSTPYKVELQGGDGRNGRCKKWLSLYTGIRNSSVPGRLMVSTDTAVQPAETRGILFGILMT